MSAFAFTPARRVALAIVATGYIFLSHYLFAGGLLPQILGLFLGFGLIAALFASRASSRSAWSVSDLLQEISEERAMDIGPQRRTNRNTVRKP
jgi:hypothetical protein